MAGDAESGEGGGYRELYRFYAGRFGTSLRTIKRWVSVGREKADPCPLDDPKELAGWWTRHMKQRVPEEILRECPLYELPVAVVKEPELELAAVDVVISEPELPVDENEVGLEQTLRRLQEKEVVLSRRAGEPGQAKAWLDTIGRIGPMTKQLREENEKLRKLIPRDQAEQILTELLQPVEREIRLMYRTMCEVIGLPASPEKEEKWTAECDRLFARMQNEVFR